MKLLIFVDDADHGLVMMKDEGCTVVVVIIKSALKIRNFQLE